ncbi:MAG: hypothetical protein Q4B82_01965 [Alysiella sp.]|uniref:hypothetical protein n=1 Tax=Alysiella sp. TaxID=1872483 RepID=UPI0026DA9D69|nr:hypothetical protein [Alysiella sp.]MDO4433329.1 hypothetical protein [Alysiella sp.]
MFLMRLRCVLCLFLLGACSNVVQVMDKTAVLLPYATSSVVATTFDVDILENKPILSLAQRTLQQLPEFSGSNIKVFEKISFFNGTRPRIELFVLHPKLPKTLVLYTFEHNQWRASEAEDASHIQFLHHHLFDLNSMDFAAAADYAALWRQHAQQLNAVITEPYHVAFIYLPKQNKRFWHTTILEVVGVQYYLSFHEDSTIWELKRL